MFVKKLVKVSVLSSLIAINSFACILGEDCTTMNNDIVCLPGMYEPGTYEYEYCNGGFSKKSVSTKPVFPGQSTDGESCYVNYISADEYHWNGNGIDWSGDKEVDNLPGTKQEEYGYSVLPGVSYTSDRDTAIKKEDVDKIVKREVQKALELCRADPNFCGIKTYSTSVSDLFDVKSRVENRSLKITGYFLNYGDGAYDWLYVSSNGSYVAKLEEGVDENGNLRWLWINTPDKPGFDYVNLDLINKSVNFGSMMADESALPGF